MIYYLVIGHACDEEQESLHLSFEREQSDGVLEKRFIRDTLKELGYDPDDDEYELSGKEVYIDYILKSDSPIEINYG